MQTDNDMILYLDNKEDLSYLINGYGTEGYGKRAAAILVELFSVVPEEMYISVVNSDTHPVILCGLIFCAHDIVYEFELMREDMAFRFRISHDKLVAMDSVVE